MVIISLILVGIIISPYIFFNYFGKSESKKLSRKFSEIVKSENLNLDEKESWGNSIIGIDKTKHILVFIRRDGEAEKIEIINLSQVENSHLDERYKEFVRNNKKDKTLENLNLVLERADHKPANILNFYNRDFYYYEQNEKLRAEKWKSIISQNLKGLSVRAA